MSAQRARKPYDRWRDVDGIHINDGRRVQQIDVDKQHGALPFRLHKRGIVVGRAQRTGNRLHVLFDGEPTPVGIRPHLVRVLPLGAEIIIKQIEGLRPDALHTPQEEDGERDA